MAQLNAEQVTAAVKSRYADMALASHTPGVRTASDVISTAMGYSPAELASIPAEANMGLSCGNTIEIANLRAGETVLDLGSGGGLDAFLASKAVGASGKVIGVDMTEEMVMLAKENAKKGGFKNVEFVHSGIEDMVDDGRVPENSVDCVISNCVLNLCPDKPRAFKAVHAVLKPGGRLVASDIALKTQLPDAIKNDVMAYTGCIAGAVLIGEYKKMLEEAGFGAVEILDAGKDLNVYRDAGEGGSCCGPAQPAASSCCGPAPVQPPSSCCGPAPAQPAASCCGPAPTTSSSSCCGPAQPATSSCCAPAPSKPSTNTVSPGSYDVNEYATSVKVFAVKL